MDDEEVTQRYQHKKKKAAWLCFNNNIAYVSQNAFVWYSTWCVCECVFSSVGSSDRQAGLFTADTAACDEWKRNLVFFVENDK